MLLICSTRISSRFLYDAPLFLKGWNPHSTWRFAICLVRTRISPTILKPLAIYPRPSVWPEKQLLSLTSGYLPCVSEVYLRKTWKYFYFSASKLVSQNCKWQLYLQILLIKGREGVPIEHRFRIKIIAIPPAPQKKEFSLDKTLKDRIVQDEG